MGMKALFQRHATHSTATSLSGMGAFDALSHAAPKVAVGLRDSVRHALHTGGGHAAKMTLILGVSASLAIYVLTAAVSLLGH